MKAIIDRDRGGGSGSAIPAQATLKALPTVSMQPLPAAPTKQILITRRASDIRPQILRRFWQNHIQLGVTLPHEHVLVDFVGADKVSCAVRSE